MKIKQRGNKMKLTMTFLFLTVSLAAFAQDSSVELNQGEIYIKNSQAIVTRTNKTPNIVTLSFLVPMKQTVCKNYERRMVVKTSGQECGYDKGYKKVSTGMVCVKKNPSTQKCIRYEETYKYETTLFPRTCVISETYCAEYGTVVNHFRDSVRIKFDNLPALGDSESETFFVSAQQKNVDGVNVSYSFTTLNTLSKYKISQKKILFWKRDYFVVSEK
jgi:hypothetical protein